MKEFNCINIFFEIDFYLLFFSEWWGGKVFFMNYGVCVFKNKGDVIIVYDEVYKESYFNLCLSFVVYKQVLFKYKDMSYEEYFKDCNVNEFYLFIYFNYWYYKKLFGGGLDMFI